MNIKLFFQFLFMTLWTLPVLLCVVDFVFFLTNGTNLTPIPWDTTSVAIIIGWSTIFALLSDSVLNNS